MWNPSHNSVKAMFQLFLKLFSMSLIHKKAFAFSVGQVRNGSGKARVLEWGAIAFSVIVYREGLIPIGSCGTKPYPWASHMALMVMNPPANSGDRGLIPVLGRCPGEGNGNPLEYLCLGNPMDKGWDATEQLST